MRSGPAIGVVLGAVASACAHTSAVGSGRPPAAPPAQPVVNAQAPTPPTEPSQARPSDLIEENYPMSIITSEKADTPPCKRAKTEFEDAWNTAVVCRIDSECAIYWGNCTAARPDAKALLDLKLDALGRCVDMLAVPICKHTTPVCFRGRCKVRGCQVKEKESECS